MFDIFKSDTMMNNNNWLNKSRDTQNASNNNDATKKS
jgi:hypothetical protein